MVEVSNLTRSKVPSLPLEEVADRICGRRFSVSIAFVGRTRAQRLNMEHRNMSYVPNVLTFPLSSTSGEIVICPEVAKRQYKRFELSYQGFLTLLVIHGCLHLRGIEHGDTMEQLEEQYLKEFTHEKNRTNGDRRRHTTSEGRRHRIRTP